MFKVILDYIVSAGYPGTHEPLSQNELRHSLSVDGASFFHSQGSVE